MLLGCHFPPGSVILRSDAEVCCGRWQKAGTRVLARSRRAGALVAPLLVPWLTIQSGWPTVFLMTGALGFAWLVPWWLLYRDPEKHPRM